MIRRVVHALALLLSILFLVFPANAHQLGQSVVFLTVTDDQVVGRLEITLPDLNRILGTELPEDKTASQGDVASVTPLLRAHLERYFTISSNEVTLPLEFNDTRLSALRIAQYVHVDFVIPGPPRDTLSFSYDTFTDIGYSDHVCFVVVENDWRSGTFNNESEIGLLLTAQEPRQTLRLKERSSWRGFQAMVALGVEHIVFGFDHVLFLVALLLPAVMSRDPDSGDWIPVSSFRAAGWNVFKIVTLFTVAHSITLSLASLKIVTMPSRLVESLIALSIAVAAFDILRPVFTHKLWLVVFVFGLFHGFGFATMLGEIPIPSEHLVLSLFAFNIGVELGQISIVCLLMPLLYALRRSAFYQVVVMRGGAVLLILIASYWFIERAFAVNLALKALLRSLVS